MSTFPFATTLQKCVVSCCLSLALSACLGGSGPGDAPSAPPPPLPPPPPGSVQLAPPAADGLPGDALKALDALGQLGQSGQTALGPVVSFRDLAPFLKDELGGFKADGELDGKTTSMRGMQVSEVKRRYKSGEQTLRLAITDTSLAPFMRAGFAMAQLVQEDSTRGYKKGGTFAGQPGIAEWKERGGQSELHLLAGGRFLIEIEISKASAGAAEQVLSALDVQAIVATAAKAQANAAKGPSGQPPTGQGN